MTVAGLRLAHQVDDDRAGDVVGLVVSPESDVGILAGRGRVVARTLALLHSARHVEVDGRRRRLRRHVQTHLTKP